MPHKPAAFPRNVYIKALKRQLQKRKDAAALELVKAVRFCAVDKEIIESCGIRSKLDFDKLVDRVHRIHYVLVRSYWTHADLAGRCRGKDTPSVLTEEGETPGKLRTTLADEELRTALAECARLLDIRARTAGRQFQELVKMESADVVLRARDLLRLEPCLVRVDEVHCVLVRCCRIHAELVGSWRGKDTPSVFTNGNEEAEELRTALAECTRLLGIRARTVARQFQALIEMESTDFVLQAEDLRRLEPCLDCVSKLIP